MGPPRPQTAGIMGTPRSQNAVAAGNRVARVPPNTAVKPEARAQRLNPGSRAVLGTVREATTEAFMADDNIDPVVDGITKRAAEEALSVLSTLLNAPPPPAWLDDAWELRKR